MRAMQWRSSPPDLRRASIPSASLIFKPCRWSNGCIGGCLKSSKMKFDRRGRSEIAPVQGLILYSIGSQELSVGELRTRGYYLRYECHAQSQEVGRPRLVEYQRSRADLRSVRIKLTATGLDVYEIMNALCQKACADVWSRRAGSMRTNLQSSTNCSIAWNDLE